MEAEHLGFPGDTVCKEPACQWRRHKKHGFSPWVGMIPWRSAWEHTLVFLPGESPWTEEPGELQSMGPQRVGHKRSKRARMHSHSRVPRTQQKLKRRELAGNAGVN